LMATRQSAGVALARFCVEIDERFPAACGPRTVWTTGRITLGPGAPSIIPGAAEMLFQIRDDDPAVIARLENLLRSMAAEVDKQGRCSVAVERIRTGAPALMDVSFQQAIEQASAAFAGGRSRHVPSGAGHDAQILATVMPAGMLFVPSIGGISHHWTEDTASITKIFSGALSDRLGKRKWLAAAGYGLAAFTKPVFPLAPTVAWLVAARFVDRIGKGIRGAPRDALVADLSPADLRGASFGLRQSLDTVGAFTGPLIAIALMWWTSD